MHQDDIDTSTANERDKQRLLDAARRAEGGERQEREPEPEIEVEEEREPGRDEPADDQDDDREPEPREEARLPRSEFRRNRYTEIERERDEERTRRIALETQIAATRTPPAPQRTREELENEARTQYLADIQAVQQARRDLQQVVQANKDNFTPEIEQRVMTEDANLRVLEAEAQERYLERRRQARQPPPTPPPNPAIQHVLGRYEHVVRDPLGMRSADLYYLKKKREGTKLSEVELVEESMRYGQAEMRGEAFSPATRERPKPTKEQKAKYAGTGAGSSSGPPEPSAKMTITKREDELAQKLYKHIQDPAERRRMYYKNVKMKRGA